MELRLIGALLGLCAAGCGTVVQSVAGWHSEEERVDQVSKRVAIESDPPGARVVREDKDRQVVLGRTPLEDHVDVVRTQRVLEPTHSWLWVGLGVGVAGMIGSVGAAMSSCSTTLQGARDCSAPWMAAAAAFSFGMMIDLVALVGSWASNTRIEEEPVLDAPKVHYRAEMSGYESATHFLTVRADDGVKFRLLPLEEEKQPLLELRNQAVIAVMPLLLRDLTGGPSLAAFVPALEDQLRVGVTTGGARAIDRGAQDSALKEQIDTIKADSYGACYDEACQIELGKAVAATHLLRSKVSALGTQCLMSAELIELKLEVAVAATSTRGACAPEVLVDLTSELASSLMLQL